MQAHLWDRGSRGWGEISEGQLVEKTAVMHSEGSQKMSGVSDVQKAKRQTRGCHQEGMAPDVGTSPKLSPSLTNSGNPSKEPTPGGGVVFGA